MVTEADIKFEEKDGRGRYSIVMPNGEESRLTYATRAPGHIVADHTFVPVPYRGDGIAEMLVERLFADARAKGVKIAPACWFVADEFARHSPAWDDVREK